MLVSAVIVCEVLLFWLELGCCFWLGEFVCFFVFGFE